MPRVSVAVIIPTLNEATTIQCCLERISAQSPDEIVVVDANSQDGTAELARASGLARVLNMTGGRGRQQNEGVRATASDVLLFLHADCWLEAGALLELRWVVQVAPRVPGGCFRMRVASDDLRFRAIEAGGDLRAG